MSPQVTQMMDLKEKKKTSQIWQKIYTNEEVLLRINFLETLYESNPYTTAETKKIESYIARMKVKYDELLSQVVEIITLQGRKNYLTKDSRYTAFQDDFGNRYSFYSGTDAVMVGTSMGKWSYDENYKSSCL